MRGWLQRDKIVSGVFNFLTFQELLLTAEYFHTSLRMSKQRGTDSQQVASSREAPILVHWQNNKRCKLTGKYTCVSFVRSKPMIGLTLFITNL